MARWQKGQSGNPGGRKKGFGDLRELARTHTNSAIATLVQVMGDESAPPSARVSAAEALLDRGWGRSTLQIAATVGTQSTELALGFAAELLRHVRTFDAQDRHEAAQPLQLIVDAKAGEPDLHGRTQSNLAGR